MNVNFKSLAIKVFLNIVLIAVTCYFLFQYVKMSGNSISTERADIEIRQDIVETYGYIFRNEEVIYSPGGGSVNYLIENSRKVGKNELIAQSYYNNADFSSKDQIAALTEKLDTLNKSNLNLEFVTINIEKIESDSQTMYVDMLKNIESGKIIDAGRQRKDFLILSNKKQLITHEVSENFFSNIIKSAEDKKTQLENQLTNAETGGTDIFSDRSGVFYTNVDGYENYLTADALKTLDFSKFDELINQKPDNNILNNALGKIAYDFNWYLVCKTKKNKDIDFIAGNEYNIIYPFSSNKSITSVLTKQIDSASSDEVILIFETDSIPLDFDFSRKQMIQIILNEVGGIKVPEEALQIIQKDDGTTIEGVYILKGNLVVFRELPKNECLGKFGGYYLYLEPSKRPETGGGTLQLYEDIIVSGKNLYDGKAAE